MKLSIRLQAIADMVPCGAKLADIGTDHAYLPLYLIKQGKISFAVAGEVNRGPYDSAKNMLRKMNCHEKISLRFGNGLKVVREGEVDTVVIAGMGGSTMIDILSAQTNVTESLKTLILQPMIASGSVRRWLVENGWTIQREALAKEDSILYEIILARQGVSETIDPILFDIGPVLWRERHPLLKEHIKQLTEKTRHIIRQMSCSKDAEKLMKYKEYSKRLAQLEDKLSCL